MRKKKEKVKKGIKIILLFASITLITLLIILICFWHPKIHFSENSISKIVTQEKILVLTFDDGPGEQTQEILDVLKEKNVSATFFLVGEQAEWHVNETKRILMEGQEIGNHAYKHKFSLFGGLEDYVSGKESLEQITGENTTYYRPPYGFRTIKTVKEAKANNIKIILWDIMPKDFMGWDEKKISEYVLKKIEPGSIIVLHDGPEKRESTVKALAKIIDGARAQGYEFISLSEALLI